VIVTVTHFTDPACPWDFAAEPIRLRLETTFGNALRWRRRLIVLAEDPSQAPDPRDLVDPHAMIRARFGQPASLVVKPRPSATRPACLAVVAARRQGLGDRLLRELRLLVVGEGRLIDLPETLAEAVRRAGADRARLEADMGDPAVDEALTADMEAARTTSAAARAIPGATRTWHDGRARYTAPSYVYRRGDVEFVLPGMRTWDAHQAVVANLAPEAPRAPAPSVAAVLRPESLTTAEIAMVCDLSIDEARGRLVALAEAGRAVRTPLAQDATWRLRAD